MGGLLQMQAALFLFSFLGGKTMTDTEKQLLQAKHRLEEAQARDRAKERKTRTRRLMKKQFQKRYNEQRGGGDPAVDQR